MGPKTIHRTTIHRNNNTSESTTLFALATLEQSFGPCIVLATAASESCESGASLRHTRHNVV